VLAVVLFLGFWVVLALGLFFIAIRGGLGGARAALQTQSRGGRKAVGITFVIVYVGFGIAVPVAFLSGNHAKASAQIGGIKLNAAEKRGRELFGQNCGVCHTLAGANAVGKVGPNLDSLKPPESLVLNTIANGCVQNPPPNSPETCLGQGTMPSQLVQGKDAQDVAQFVAKVAGKE
jgi:mono/diheme cytochrome c family protein